MANTVTKKTQLSHGVWVVPDGDNSWGGELNDNFVLLNGLLDRKTLTFTKNAQTVATFNGTQNVTVDIGTQFATNEDIDGIFGDSQTQPDLTKDVNVGNLDRFKTDLSSRVVSSVSLDNNDDLEVTYLDGQSHTVSLPWPEVPTVPVSVVDGAIVDTNKLELTFSDQTTKQLTLPSGGGGSSPVTRTVTRVPVYFEIHFKVGEVAGSVYDECAADSVLGITAQDVKDIVRVSSENEYYYKDTPAPGGIVVTDVTSTKAYDEFDKVFLVAVNLVVPYIVGDYNPKGTIYFTLGKSFGDITISDSKIMSAINQARQSQGEEQIQSCSAQIAGGYPQLSFGGDSTVSDISNYFEITAYIDNHYIDHYDSSARNSWFGYNSELGSNCAFKLQVINMTSLTTPVTFTVSE